VHVKGEEADIVLLEQCKYDPRWMLTKLQIIRDLREYAGMNKVRLIEEYVKPEEKKDETAAAAAPAEPAHEHDHEHDHEHPHEHAEAKKDEAPKAEEPKAEPAKVEPPKA